MWLLVSVLQTQRLMELFIYLFIFAKTQGENNQEQVHFTDRVDAAESLPSSLPSLQKWKTD